MGTTPTRPTAGSKRILEEFFQSVWNEKRLDRVDEFVTEDFVTSGVTGPLSTGRDAFKAFTRDFLAAVPDYRIELLDQVEEDDKVAVRWVCHGTHLGTLFGVKATGRRFRLSGISIYRFRDGKLAEVWRERDFPGMWRQLLPEAGLDENGVPKGWAPTPRPG